MVLTAIIRLNNSTIVPRNLLYDSALLVVTAKYLKKVFSLPRNRPEYLFFNE
jgi:hypothetical protein